MLRYSVIALLFVIYTPQQELSFHIKDQAGNNRITPTEKVIYYNLSKNIIPIRILQYGAQNNLVFINLHDDEKTSVEAAMKILEQYGGTLIKLDNKGERNISYRLGRYAYHIDPNRIFSESGIRETLEELGRTGDKAVSEAKLLGERILQLIPLETSCVIALHNNTADLYSARDYLPGQQREKDSKKVSINPSEDSDDFFLTTDNQLYRKLSEKGFNTILQDNRNCKNDGSLSYYFGRVNLRYVNCETEHGKTEQYFKMMKALISSL